MPHLGHMLMENKKIYLVSSISGANLENSWHRDQGLLTDTLRKLGYSASLVCPAPDPRRPDERFLIARPEELQEPGWWQQQAPWAVVFNTWGRKAYQPWWNAAVQATPRVMERLDTDGMRSPRVDLPLYLHRLYSGLGNSREPWQRFGRHVLPGLLAGYHLLRPKVLDAPMCRALAGLPLVAAESPVAAERIGRLLRMMGHSGNNVVLLPHPIIIRKVPDFQQAQEREKLVVAVGRWGAFQKNFPMMLKVLARFLEYRPNWRAELYGSVPEELAGLFDKFTARCGNRIIATGQVSNTQLLGAMNKARIFLNTSRYEGFSLAVAEALCAGCSVVASPHIAGMHWCGGSDSGTVATYYSVNSLLDALSAEATLWNQGMRDPIGIANTWQARVGAEAVTKNMLKLLTQSQ